jgi:hypothetical protein
MPAAEVLAWCERWAHLGGQRSSDTPSFAQAAGA